MCVYLWSNRPRKMWLMSHSTPLCDRLCMLSTTQTSSPFRSLYVLPAWCTPRALQALFGIMGYLQITNLRLSPTTYTQGCPRVLLVTSPSTHSVVPWGKSQSLVLSRLSCNTPFGPLVFAAIQPTFVTLHPSLMYLVLTFAVLCSVHAPNT
jgi:hypothetical protein